MFNHIRIYTVHIKPDIPISRQKPLFIREGFNLWAFILALLWVLYQRLWLPALCIVLFNAMLFFIMKNQILSMPSTGALQLALDVVIGSHGNDWLRAKLARQGYIMADISAADSLLGAEQRYFERALAAA